MALKKSYYSNQSSLENAAKTLLANIRFSGIDEPIRSVVVTSSVPDEGKTTVACELARAMASSGKTTLLVECDMRRRSVAHMLGVRSRLGLYGVLTGESKLSDAIVHVGEGGLYFLDAEPAIPNPSDVIASKRFAALADVLGERFGFVVFDTPPVDAFVDAAVLSGIADATVVVVREKWVRRESLLSTHEQLKKAGANVIGAVMNRCTAHGSSYYVDYYGEEGQASGAAGASRASQRRDRTGGAGEAPGELPNPRTWGAADTGDAHGASGMPGTQAAGRGAHFNADGGAR